MEKNKIPMNSIEIDDDVLRILKQNAEPFDDTPNTVLRRILGIDKNVVSKQIVMPELPPFIPKALIQILEVIYLVIAEGYSRNQATNFVADKYSIYPQTVMDKYCRQLQMTANEIEQLLNDSDIRKLRLKLKNRFSKYSNDIDKYFQKIRNKSINNSWTGLYS